MSEQIQNDFIKEWDVLLKQYWASIQEPDKNKTKIKGALGTSLIREYVQKVVDEQNIDVAISPSNAFISGYSTEFDLLILGKNTNPLYTDPYIYMPKDIIGVIECKTTGVWPREGYNGFAKELNVVAELRQKGIPVNFAYITISEAWNKNLGKSIQFEAAQNWIDQYLSKGVGKQTAYCFNRIGRKKETILWDANGRSFNEIISSLCIKEKLGHE